MANEIDKHLARLTDIFDNGKATEIGAAFLLENELWFNSLKGTKFPQPSLHLDDNIIKQDIIFKTLTKLGFDIDAPSQSVTLAGDKILRIDLTRQSNEVLKLIKERLPFLLDSQQLEENTAIKKEEIANRISAQEFLHEKSMLQQVKFEKLNTPDAVATFTLRKIGDSHHKDFDEVTETLRKIGVGEVVQKTNHPETLIVHGQKDVEKITQAINGHVRFMAFQSHSRPEPEAAIPHAPSPPRPGDSF